MEIINLGGGIESLIFSEDDIAKVKDSIIKLFGSYDEYDRIGYKIIGLGDVKFIFDFDGIDYCLTAENEESSKYLNIIFKEI